jgi:hypothetical protein
MLLTAAALDRPIGHQRYCAIRAQGIHARLLDKANWTRP